MSEQTGEMRDNVWTAWEKMTLAMIEVERLAAHPFGRSRFEDATGYVDDILASVRKGRESAIRHQAVEPCNLDHTKES